MSSSATITERPMLFSGPMVRAILDDRKTQTRRIINPQPTVREDGSLMFPWASFWPNGTVHTFDRNGDGGQNWNANDYPNENRYNAALRRTPYVNPCRYGRPGDRLWVRETFSLNHSMHYGHRTLNNMSGIIYRASWSRDVDFYDRPFVAERRWRPSIHMARVYCRLLLEITEVRVERLQDITEEDAIAEGAQCAGFPASLTNYGAFGRLWQTINGKDSWTANPWVWAVSFKRVSPESN